MSESPPTPGDSLETVENHAAAEGAEAESAGGIGSKSSLQEMLMSTEPTESLEQIENPWNPEQGGFTRIYRGVKKMTGVEGLPAVLDISIGMVEVFKTFQLEGGSNADSNGDERPEGPQEQAGEPGPNDPIL